ncbi:MAG: IS630 transposase-related protein, partial [Wolbachia endosymbiont of Melophagus ovinus]|nr:IS630 transposase-related protein [Wolbachia endosymbiont of Melophagus ovinus]
MPRPYSEDLRKRVLKVVDEKKTMEEISKMFKIDRKTIYWWKKRREETL